MSRFRQAAPDPEKAARDGVANYVPSRHQVNLNHTCADCTRTATWTLQIDDRTFHACNNHRRDHAITARGTYSEKRIR